ncbi:hypothetical protein AB0C90_02485 [Streptomyces sp. NPDC048550]|uniref:hypothetical protein n=1 Tax=Streptomyces sp. NPDC048550 TaxID=3155739 RepID=UPI00342075C5
MILLTTAMASAAVSALGDNAHAGTAAQAYAAADVPTPSAAPARPEAGEVAAAEVGGRPQDAPAGPAGQTVSNRPHYGARLLDLQRADGRATQVWTVQKVG